jgi:putative membrane protein
LFTLNAGNEKLIGNDLSVELSANRTAMSIERTHMSIDRTLMSVVRTSLSLIAFGFTIFQVFNAWIDRMPGVIETNRPKRLALILVGLGIVMLVLGIWNHWEASRALDQRRAYLHGIGLIHHRRQIRPSSTAIIALLLLLTGLATFAGIAFRLNTFGL